MLTRWHADYLHVLSSIDTRDEASARGEDSLFNAEDQAFARVQDALQRADTAAVGSWLARDPRLGHYRAFIAESCRRSSKPLSRNEQELATQATSWQFRLYQQLDVDSTLDRDKCAFALERTVRRRTRWLVRGCRRTPGVLLRPPAAHVRRRAPVDRRRARRHAVQGFEARSRAYDCRCAAACCRSGHPTAMRRPAPLGPELAGQLERCSTRRRLGWVQRPPPSRRVLCSRRWPPRRLPGQLLDSRRGRLVHESGHALHYRVRIERARACTARVRRGGGPVRQMLRPTGWQDLAIGGRSPGVSTSLKSPRCSMAQDAELGAGALRPSTV